MSMIFPPIQSVCVIGLGYIGLPSAVLFAKGGLRVFGCDINPHIVAETNAGRLHIVEPGLHVLLSDVIRNGMLTADTKPSVADAYTITVPTPVTHDEQRLPDIRYVEAAARAIAPLLKPGALVVLESTSPVNTTRRVMAIITELRPDLTISDDEKSEIDFCYSPERVIPGRTVEELRRNDRVIGGVTRRATERASSLFRRFSEGRLLATDDRTAEAVKLTENAFRDVNIAFANELSLVCDRLGVNVFDVIRLANHHPRVNILSPGPGVGGHCIAVDPWFLIAGAPQEARLMRMARTINDAKPHWVLARAEEMLASRPEAQLVCLGLTYKADVDDFRESPSLEIALELSRRHPDRVVVFDPYIHALKARDPDTVAKMTVVDLPTAARCPLALVLVGHLELRGLQFTADQLVLDTIGLYTRPPQWL